eukprot:TRINITY_DN81406_c0_g1_i1.p1 TRINITY_DN81406_c0_g1~~TRINITY_DN81406_c0_g1_i1.p1  ORF type:complete len:337 (-),score=65.09 TRINITY_DN81406_c0_g1_i1:27-1037(-)
MFGRMLLATYFLNVVLIELAGATRQAGVSSYLADDSADNAAALSVSGAGSSLARVSLSAVGTARSADGRKLENRSGSSGASSLHAATAAAVDNRPPLHTATAAAATEPQNALDNRAREDIVEKTVSNALEARNGTSSSLLEAVGAADTRVLLPATRLGVTQVHRGGKCPHEAGVGNVGCLWGCQCSFFESCFPLSSPMRLDGNGSNGTEISVLEHVPQFRTASGQVRAKIGVCSVSAGWLTVSSCSVFLAMVASIAITRACLQHRESVLQLEDELKKMNNESTTASSSSQAAAVVEVHVSAKANAEAKPDGGCTQAEFASGSTEASRCADGCPRDS